MKFFKNSEKTHCLEKNLLVPLESIKILTSKYKYTGDYLNYNKWLGESKIVNLCRAT